MNVWMKNQGLCSVFPADSPERLSNPNLDPGASILEKPPPFSIPPGWTLLQTLSRASHEKPGGGEGGEESEGEETARIPWRKEWFTAACGEGSDSCLGLALAHKPCVWRRKKTKKTEEEIRAWAWNVHMCGRTAGKEPWACARRAESVFTLPKSRPDDGKQAGSPSRTKKKEIAPRVCHHRFLAMEAFKLFRLHFNDK